CDETAEPERGAHVGGVGHPERHDRHATLRSRAREHARWVRRDRRRDVAGRELADERQHLDLAPAPRALRIDVQDPERHASRHRIRTASASHIAIATSLSPKLYWVAPPTRNPTTPHHAPAAAHAAGPRARRTASQPARSADR